MTGTFGVTQRPSTTIFSHHLEGDHVNSRLGTEFLYGKQSPPSLYT